MADRTMTRSPAAQQTLGSDAHAQHRAALRRMFDAVVDAANPEHLVIRHLPRPPRGRTLILSAGKAAAVMAKAADEAWDAPLSGLAVTPYGHGVACPRVEVIEASHPVPDQAGQSATARFLDEAKALGPDDLLLCLISGGASALLAAPVPGITLTHKQSGGNRAAGTRAAGTRAPGTRAPGTRAPGTRAPETRILLYRTTESPAGRGRTGPYFPKWGERSPSAPRGAASSRCSPTSRAAGRSLRPLSCCRRPLPDGGPNAPERSA